MGASISGAASGAAAGSALGPIGTVAGGVLGALGGLGGSSEPAPPSSRSEAVAPNYGGINFKGNLYEAERTTTANARTNDGTADATLPQKAGETWIWAAVAAVIVLAGVFFLRPKGKKKRK